MPKLQNTSVRLPLLLDIMERVVVAAFFGLMVSTFLRAWHQSGDMSILILVASEASVVGFVLIRRLASEVSMRPGDWLMALLGTTVPLLVQPTGGDGLVPAVFCVPLMLIGISVQISAKFTLRRSFGVVAANRGVKVGGPYRLVRHPMYAGYFMTQIGFLLLNPSWWNLTIYAAGFAFQITRILAEERLLSQDLKYGAFSVAVPYRLVPGIL